jgi:DNA-binding LacI/PurR family transcriptional regulator
MEHAVGKFILGFSRSRCGGRKSMDVDGRTRAFLVMCDDAQTANALVTRIKRLGDIVYAANESEALRQLAQYPLDAAVLARQADTDAVAVALGAKGIPFCVLDKGSATPVTVSAGEVVFSDADLVVPTLRALVARRRKKRA